MRQTLVLTILLAGAWLGAATSASASVPESELDGVWELIAYELPDKSLEVSGLLLMQRGYFAMDYAMQAQGGLPSARSHSGTYRLESGQLLFNVERWIESVEGVARIVAPTKHGAKITLDGGDLRLVFASGSAQHWRRVQPGNQPATD